VRIVAYCHVTYWPVRFVITHSYKTHQ